MFHRRISSGNLQEITLILEFYGSTDTAATVAINVTDKLFGCPTSFEVISSGVKMRQPIAFLWQHLLRHTLRAYARSMSIKRDLDTVTVRNWPLRATVRSDFDGYWSLTQCLRTASVRSTYGCRRGVYVHGYGVTNFYGEHRNEKSLYLTHSSS